ncbi:hypothetical protein DEU31_3012 [Brachybacterium sp. AG952]|uniref:helix-turn-helix transcriptional regulator n=1 Tax=Brachybacterium sp. AG952 TaxID=2183989 RepID=UPI00105CB643|nr:helix-turn-helix transcriptional regulator [Brachybacterium sp. AG952]TDP76305.1 hypothetical protein DEU31_3012 [Brachybacterium sp. AG952]
MTALSDLLTQSNANGWSTREIARQAEKKQHQLAQPTVSKYMSGRHGTPTEPVLEAFSDVLNIPIHKLRAAAGVPTGDGEPWAPPAEANRLDRRQRLALEELIRSMVASETSGEDRTDDDQDATRMGRETQPDGLTKHAGAQHPAAGADDTNQGGSDADPNAYLPQRGYENVGSRDDRPWEQDEYGLAAKRGRNRGREARQQQDREAEGGGA